jgi:hypothetical protein
MDLSPFWETADCAATQEFPTILRNPKVHYRAHKSPSPVPILSQMIQSIPSHPISLRSILILSTHLRLCLHCGLFPSGFPTNILIHSSSSHSCYMSFPSYPPWLDHCNYIWRRKQSLELLIMQCSHQPQRSGMLGQMVRHERITHRQHGDHKGLLLFLKTKKIYRKLS